jgi:hypothetical protein
MAGNHRRVARDDQECAPGNSLDVAAEAEHEPRDKVHDAPGFRVFHVLEVDDDRNSLAKVIPDGGGILKVPGTHYGDLDAVTHGELAVRGFIVVRDLQGIVIVLDPTQPSAGVALHSANLRRNEPHGRPSGGTTVDAGNRSEPGWIKL